MSASSPARPHRPGAQGTPASSSSLSGAAGKGSAAAVTSGPGPMTKPAPAPTTRAHGPTTLTLLQIQWDYPVYHGPVTKSDGAQAASKPVLSREEALRAIAKDDPR